MNIFYKAYCRTYQAILRMGLPALPYRAPEILRSAGEIPGLLEKNARGRALIVTDRGCVEAGLLKILTDALKEGGQSYTVFDGVVSNPTTDTVDKALSKFTREKCVSLIGLGGGSSMDCAKAVGARIARPDKTLGDMEGILRIRKEIPYLISVPTTAGTGSETTLAAVITDARTRHKYAINDFPLIPRAAVLDPEFTRTLPKNMTASTGMDALTHAVEAYIGRSTTRETRAWAVRAVKLIFENLQDVYDDGENMEARSNMMEAAYCAGAAFSQSYVGYVHAVAHSLGGQYDIPHGLANAVLLPVVLECYGSSAQKKLHRLAVAHSLGGQYDIPHGLANAVLLPVVLECYGSSAQKKLHRLAVAAGIASHEESAAAGSEKFICAVREMNRRLGIPETLPGIKEEDIPMMAAYAAREADPLYPVPVIWGADQLERFYYAVMDRQQISIAMKVDRSENNASADKKTAAGS